MNQRSRNEIIRVLLRTRLEYLPGVQGMRLGAIPGEAPGNEVPCEVCHKHGKVKRKRNGWESFSYCPTCKGSGWRKASRGEQTYDPYTREKVTSYESPNPPSMTSKQLDSSLERLRNDSAARAGVTRSEGRLEKARTRRDATGSYADLEKALEWLRGSYPELSRLLVMIYDSGLSPRLSERDRFNESIAVNLLSHRLPKRLWLPSWEHRKIRDKRHRQILGLAKMRLNKDAIAEKVGVSKRYVSRVLSV